MKQLDKRIAIITGAGSGIGKETALLFAREGAKIVVSDINREAGEKVASEIKENGGDAIFIQADTSKPEDHEILVDQTLENYGKLDIAVNNAGIGGASAPTGEYPLDS